MKLTGLIALLVVILTLFTGQGVCSVKNTLKTGGEIVKGISGAAAAAGAAHDIYEGVKKNQ